MTIDTKSYIKSIAFPEPGQLRARKVVSRSRARSTGKFPSWKMRRMIQFESRNELSAFMLLDCDPHVSSFSEQPCEVQYVVDGLTKSHYPDILVEIDGQKELWEVKPESMAIKPDMSARTALLVRTLPAWGFTYRIVLDRDLALQPRLSNADKLLRFGRYAVTECEQEHIRIALKQHGSLLWSRACSGEYGARGREILSSLVLHGALAIDMSSPLTPTTSFVAGIKGL